MVAVSFIIGKGIVSCAYIAENGICITKKSNVDNSVAFKILWVLQMRCCISKNTKIIFPALQTCYFV